MQKTKLKNWAVVRDEEGDWLCTFDSEDEAGEILSEAQATAGQKGEKFTILAEGYAKKKLNYVCSHCGKVYDTKYIEFEGEDNQEETIQSGVGDCCIDSPTYYESD